MATHPPSSPLPHGVHTDAFDIQSLDDEIRVDQLCVELLRSLSRHLVDDAGQSPEKAGEACHGADYFLREFIIADRNENLFRIDPVRVRQFAGHWYIIRTLEPNLTELGGILEGTAIFYRFLADHQLVTQELAQSIQTACADHAYYAERLAQFWAIENDGFAAWRQACPLEPGH